MKKGFTLIEILAVVTLMGLIFILVIPKISKALKSKKTDIDKTTNDMILTAAKLYVNNNKDFFDKDKDNVYCLPVYQLVNQEYLESKIKNVTDDIDITNTMSVKITFDNKFKYELMDKKDCQVVKQENKNIEYLVNKANPVTVANYADGNTKEMYTFNHPATTQTGALTDYRYIGSNPNNYVTFNNELWRIIGVFSVEDGNGNVEQRIKIVRNEQLSSEMAWDSIEPYENEWTSAPLNTYLNGEYYNGLDDKSKSMIADTKYYLGGSSVYNELTGEDYYNFERGTEAYSGRSTSWNGKIALMYPSDYAYTYALGVDNICYTDGYNCKVDAGGTPTNGWIYNTNNNSGQWILAIRSSTSDSAFHIHTGGYVSGRYDVNGTRGIRPVVFLISNIKISSGDGSAQNPYQLKI